MAFGISAGTAFIDVLPNMAGFVAGMQKGMVGLGSRLSSVGSKLTRSVTLPVVGAAAASIKLAADFETSMDHIVGLVGVSREQVDEWSDEILQMAEDLPQSPKELAEALYFVTSAGFSGSAAMRVLDASAKAAAAGLGDTMTVADAVTSAVNAYGEKVLSAAQATDILTNTVKLGKAEASSIAPVLGSLLPTASELDVAFHDVAASIAAMTRTGDSAASAATKTNAIFSALVKTTAQQEQAFKKAGFSSEQLRESLAERGLLPTLVSLKDAVDGDVAALAEMFPNVRALRGVLSLTGNQVETNTELFLEMAKGAGLTDEALAAVSDSAEFKLKSAMSTLQAAGIRLGRELIPVLLDIVEVVEGWVKAFSRLDPETKQMIIKVALLAAAVGPLLLVFGKLLKISGGLIGFFTRLGGAAVGAAGPIARTGEAMSTTATAGASLGRQFLRGIGRAAAYGAAIAAVGLAVKEVGDYFGQLEDFTNETDRQLRLGIGTIEQWNQTARDNIDIINHPISSWNVANAIEEGTEKFKAFRQEVDLMNDSQRLELGRQALQDLRDEFAKGEISFDRYAEAVSEIEDVYTLLFPAGQKLINQQEDMINRLGRFADEVIGASGATDQQRREMEQLIPAYRGLGIEIQESTLAGIEANFRNGQYETGLLRLKGAIELGLNKALRKHQDELKKTERADIEAAIEAGNLELAMKLLKKAIEKVPERAKTKVEADTGQAMAAIDRIREQLRSLTDIRYLVTVNADGSINTGVGGNTRGALGGIIMGAAGGITRSPVLIGEARSMTPWGRGAEALIPLNERGIGILTEALSMAIEPLNRSRSLELRATRDLARRGDSTVKIAGQLSLDEDGSAYIRGVAVDTSDREAAYRERMSRMNR